MTYQPNNANGQATAANSAPVVLASDQVSTIAGDSGQTALVVVGQRKDSGSQALSTSNYPSSNGIDCSNFAWVSVQVQAYTSGTLTFQVSNDNATWTSLALINAASANSSYATTAAATGVFHGPIAARYFRVTGGVATIFVEFFAVPRTPLAPSVTATLSGTSAVQGGKTNNNAAPGATNLGVLPVIANAAVPAITEGNLAALSADLSGNLRTSSTPYPAAATPETAASGNVANAAAVATLATASSKTTYMTGFVITSSGATVGAVVNVTVVGVITGTLTFTYAAPAGVLSMGTPLVVNFPFPIPASATNTTIVVTLPALGAGNTNAAAVATGFQL